MSGKPTHGGWRTPVWAVWCAMIQRCTNPKSKAFKDYGGRGITVCERWRSFVAFREDMGERPEGMTIDRNGSFETSITANRRVIYLGTTADFFEACCLRKSAENTYRKGAS